MIVASSSSVEDEPESNGRLIQASVLCFPLERVWDWEAGSMAWWRMASGSDMSTLSNDGWVVR